MRRRDIIGFASAVALSGLAPSRRAAALEVGQRAPDFALDAPGGKRVTLADLLGQGPVAIYTFIQAFTGA